mmetsp:Transcript_91544/g.179308  ORF Transcript_91544/g.179308 Transcript_91544/m.179308 type:complete len:417 (+) Transcript_91544:1204-2454(+)
MLAHEAEVLESGVDIFLQVLIVDGDSIAQVEGEVLSLCDERKVADVALVVLGGHAAALAHLQESSTGGADLLRHQDGVLVEFHLEERRARAAIVRGLGSLDARPKVREPRVETGLPLVLVAVIADAHGENLRAPQLGEAAVDELGRLAEAVRVAPVPHAENAELHAGQGVAGELRRGDGAPKEARILREVAVAASRAHDDYDAVLCGGHEVVHLAHLVQVARLGHTEPALQAHAGEFLREALRDTGVRAIQDEELLPAPALRGRRAVRRRRGSCGLGSHALVALLQVGRQLELQLLGQLRRSARELRVAVLLHEELHDVASELLAIELEWVLARQAQARVVAVQRPIAAIHGFFLVQRHLRKPRLRAVLDAWRVADHDGRAVKGLGLLEGLHRLLEVRADGARGDIDGAVFHEEGP